MWYFVKSLMYVIVCWWCWCILWLLTSLLWFCFAPAAWPAVLFPSAERAFCEAKLCQLKRCVKSNPCMKNLELKKQELEDVRRTRLELSWSGSDSVQCSTTSTYPGSNVQHTLIVKICQASIAFSNFWPAAQSTWQRWLSVPCSA